MTTKGMRTRRGSRRVNHRRVIRFAPIAVLGSVLFVACAGTQPNEGNQGSEGAAETAAAAQGFEANYPTFAFARAVERNHLIVVGTAVEDLGVAEYPRVNLKDGAQAGPLSQEAPGIRTTLRAVDVESVLKGTLPGGGKRIVVEELLGTASLNPTGRYILLLSPWHDGTYQAGAYGALRLDSGGLRLAAGEAVADVFPELAMMNLEQAAATIAGIVQQQRSAGGRLAVIQPMPGSQYNLSHLWSLADLARVSIGGDAIAPASAVALRESLAAPSVAVQGEGRAPAGDIRALAFRLSGGQVIEVELDIRRGVLHFRDGVEIALPAGARAILAGAP
ncbi:MAG: hypothetical protein C0506_15540 [Anaerolinea sp.]|nr:hypothetical protein [Anaerolinea sp.]